MESIEKYGLKPSRDGYVYMGISKHIAFAHVMYTQNMNFRKWDMITIYEVDSEELESYKLKEEPAVPTCFLYADTIPTEAIKYVASYSIDELREEYRKEDRRRDDDRRKHKRTTK